MTSVSPITERLRITPNEEMDMEEAIRITKMICDPQSQAMLKSDPWSNTPPPPGTLQALLLRRLCIALTRCYLQDPSCSEHSALPLQLRKIYSLSLPVEQPIRQIIGEAKNFLKKSARECAFQPDAPSSIEDLLPGGPFSQNLLIGLYKQGIFAYNDLCNEGYLKTVPRAELSPFCQNWYAQIQQDVANGIPYALPAQVRILQQDQFVNNMSPAEFKTQISTTLQKLKTLACAGVKAAQSALCEAYDSNKLGGGAHRTKLELSSEEQINGLQMLARLGHPRSLYRLGAHYCESPLFSEDQRRERFQQLLEIESPGNFDYYITKHYIENKFGKLEFSYSLEERITFLRERAKRGDERAFRAIWKLYHTNKLGDQPVTLSLNVEERWAKLNALKTNMSASLFEEHHTVWVAEASLLCPCPLPVEKRLGWLEKEAFEKKNKTAAHCLRAIYMENRLSGLPLKIPFQKRLEKTEVLASMGNSSAMRALVPYYLPEHMGVLTDEQSQHRVVPDSPGDIPKSPASYDERAAHLLNLAVQGEHWRFCGNFSAIMENSKRERFRLIAAYGEALRTIEMRHNLSTESE